MWTYESVFLEKVCPTATQRPREKDTKEAILPMNAYHHIYMFNNG